MARIACGALAVFAALSLMVTGCSEEPNGQEECEAVATSCDELGEKRCTAEGSGIETCEADGDGCLQWTFTEDCPSNMICGDEPDAACVCVDSCADGDSRCVGTVVETCEADGDGCLQWTSTEVCPSNKICGDEPDAACVCVDSCADGDSRCVGTVVETCQQDDDGCWAFAAESDCADTSASCDDSGDVARCVFECTDQCEEGDERCHGFLIQECVTGEPCNVWSEIEDCTDSQSYCEDSAGQPVCESCMPPAEGCDEGDVCLMTTAGVFACFPAGTVGEGESCAEEACAEGLVCMSFSGVSYLCWPYCQSADDCTAPETHCIWSFQPQTTQWGVCRPGCDPVTQTDCGEGEACYYMDPDLGTTDCWAEGDLKTGDDCSSFHQLCEKGLDCVKQPDSDEYYCRPYCDDAHPCADGYACVTTDSMGLLKTCLPEVG